MAHDPTNLDDHEGATPAPTPAGLDDDARELVLSTVRRLREVELAPAACLEWDRLDVVPVEVIRRLCSRSVGLHLVFLPRAAGGLGGGARDVYRVSEELARLDLGIATAFLGLAIAVNPVHAGATDEQRRQFLAATAADGLLWGLAVTEPEAGSAITPLRTTATPVTAADGTVTYRLAGTKQFVSNGGIAEFYLVLAQAPAGPSLFVVPASTLGVVVGRREVKHGIRSSATAPLVLEEAAVPAANLVGLAEGKAMEHLGAVFGFSRVMVAAFGLGAGEAALGRAVAHSKERTQGGKPLCRLKGFTHKHLLPHVVRLEAARAFLEQLTARIDGGERELDADGAAAKLFATEAGCAAADAAIQAFGGYGYMHDTAVEQLRRDVRVTTIYEGTSEMQQAGLYLGRFRQMLRTKGAWYRDAAAPVRALGPEVAGELVADAAEALGQAITTLHQLRVSREQHAMFELADRMAEIEHAMAFCRRAAGQGAERRAACRLFAAEAAARLASSVVRLTAASKATAAELADLAAALRTQDLLHTRVGAEADKDLVLAWLLETNWPG